jgi:RecA/RadA recombinase
MKIIFPEGINNQQIIEVTGESGSGKSSFCIFMAVNFLLTHKNKSVYFVSVMKAFSFTRFEQIANYFCNQIGYNYQDLIERFINDSLQYEDYEDLCRKIENNIDSMKLGMIIVDTFTSLANYENFIDKTLYNFYEKKKFIDKQFNLFKKLIRKYEMFVFLVNDVRQDVEKNVI